LLELRVDFVLFDDRQALTLAHAITFADGEMLDDSADFE
jgi:hypothetical protein